MSFKVVALRVGSSVAASLIIYILFNIFAADSSLIVKLTVSAIALLVSLALSFYGSGSESRSSNKNKENIIADNIDSACDLNIKNIDVKSGSDVKIATNIKANGSININGISVKEN